jgi:hypothetical protein
MLATAADEGNHCRGRGCRGNSRGDSQRDPPKAKGSVEEQPQPEQQEQHTGEVLGQALRQHRTHRDGTPSASTMPAVAPIQTPAHHLWRRE